MIKYYISTKTCINERNQKEVKNFRKNLFLIKKKRSREAIDKILKYESSPHNTFIYITFQNNNFE